MGCLRGCVELARKAEEEQLLDSNRRAFLFKGASAVPVVAVAAGPTGTAAALLAPVLREVEIPVQGLHPDLVGLTIFQLSDVHLGTFIDVDQVERAVATVADRKPDLVVLTGDIADDYDKLPAALDAIAKLQPALGTFAIYGNHEVYRGRAEAKRIYDDKGVPLLRDSGTVLSRGAGQFYLGGTDDPASLGGDHRTFLANAVEKTMAACPDDITCRVLLSHRPEGFEAGQRHGASLTLSGHTHGGQVALLGRSIFEPLAPRAYLMGHYRGEGEYSSSHLFTSAGLGHWFPFRVGCPCEVTLLTLVAA